MNGVQRWRFCGGFSSINIHLENIAAFKKAWSFKYINWLQCALPKHADYGSLMENRHTRLDYSMRAREIWILKIPTFDSMHFCDESRQRRLNMKELAQCPKMLSGPGKRFCIRQEWRSREILTLSMLALLFQQLIITGETASSRKHYKHIFSSLGRK